jgi:hypothetical protein
LYNTMDDVDTFVDALQCISERNYKGKYVQDKLTGEYTPTDWHPDFSDYFTI